MRFIKINKIQVSLWAVLIICPCSIVLTIISFIIYSSSPFDLAIFFKIIAIINSAIFSFLLLIIPYKNYVNTGFCKLLKLEFKEDIQIEKGHFFDEKYVVFGVEQVKLKFDGFELIMVNSTGNFENLNYNGSLDFYSVGNYNKILISLQIFAFNIDNERFNQFVNFINEKKQSIVPQK